MTSSETLHAALADLPWLRALAARLARGDDAEADDLAQEALVTAWSRPPQGSAPASRAWLATVLRNRAWMRQRSEIRRKNRETRAVDPAEATTSGHELERLEVLREVLRRIDALPEADRRIVMGRFFDGMDASELGSELGMPAATVRSRLRRSLTRLREQLDEHHRGDRSAWAALVAVPTPGMLDTTITTQGVTLMSQGMKLVIGTTVALGLGVGIWVAQRSPSGQSSAGPGDGPSSVAVDVTNPTSEPRRASGGDVDADAEPGPVRPSFVPPRMPIPPASPPGPAEDPSSALDRAREARRAAWERCDDEHGGFGSIGIVTMRMAVVGDPEVGTFYEAIDVLESVGTREELVECVTASLREMMGPAPTAPFRQVDTESTLGQRPPEYDDEQWRRAMFESIIFAHLDDVRACERLGTAEGVPLRGAVTLAMSFDEEPAASEVVVVEPGELPAAVTECIASEARAWMFPRKSLAGPALPYTFVLPVGPVVDGSDVE
ncbi:MAG: sigma-70 family RNA polymerase sigma factor, partial [Nannocystaceae bacterium]